MSAWKPKGLYDESIKSPAAFNHSLDPALNYISTTSPFKFNHIYTQKVVNIYIVYETLR